MPKARVRWKKYRVISIAVKHGVSVVAEMLDEPNLLFFPHFTEEVETSVSDLRSQKPLFCCAVTRQFLQQSLNGEVDAEPVVDFQIPRLRINRHPGSRKVTVWPGTAEERQFASLGSKPGGVLTDRDPAAPASQGVGDTVRVLEPSDFESTSGIEVAVVWTFPLLNERLYLIHKLGRPVDPLKEVLFEQPLPMDYLRFVDILASNGSLGDWGYEER